MNLRNIRLFHCLTTSLVLTGCTIERIDLGGIDTIGEVTATDTTAHTATTTTTTTTESHTEAPDSTCLAYKDDAESAFIPCSETLEWGRQGYCVQGPLELENPPTVCPATSTTTGTTTAESTTDVIIIPPPDGSTTAAETCTYVVENGTTFGVSCGIPATTTTDSPCTEIIENGTTGIVPCVTTTATATTATGTTTSVSCATTNVDGDVVTGPCNETNPAPTCAVIDEAGNITTVDCGTTTATTGPLASDEPIAVPPPEETDSIAEEVTDASDVADAGAAPIELDATTL